MKFIIKLMQNREIIHTVSNKEAQRFADGTRKILFILLSYNGDVICQTFSVFRNNLTWSSLPYFTFNRIGMLFENYNSPLNAFGNLEVGLELNVFVLPQLNLSHE